MVRSVAQRRVSNHEASAPQQAATPGPRTRMGCGGQSLCAEAARLEI